MIFGIFFVLNLVLWVNGSSAAIPFTTFIALLALWFCVSTPLVFIGAYLGFKRPAAENPVRTNQIPRQVPEQTLYTKTLPGFRRRFRHFLWTKIYSFSGVLMGGILPFGCIFIQLFFILNSIWLVYEFHRTPFRQYWPCAYYSFYILGPINIITFLVSWWLFISY